MKYIKIVTLIIFLTFTQALFAQDGATTTLMTYNIKGYGITSSRLESIAKVINYWNADIVAVQEVDNRNLIGVKYDNLADLATQTGMKSTFLACVGTYYGIGLLTKEAPLSITTHVFPFSDPTKDKEDRGIIIAEFKDFFFIGTHYSLNADDRDVATAWIVKFAQSSDKTVFVAGDFNAQPTYRAMVTFKNSGFKILNNTNTFTYDSTNPTSCIDMVICYNDFPEAKKYDVVESGICATPGVDLKVASDHLPVYVEIKPQSTGINNVTVDSNIKIASTANGPIITGLEKPSRMKIFNIEGRELVDSIVENGENIDFSNLNSGPYILQVNNDMQKYTLKYMFNNK